MLVVRDQPKPKGPTMPRVNEKRKNAGGKERRCGRCSKTILPGERYFSWSFRYGGTHYRCAEHRPRQSELTQSLMADVYLAVEDAQDALPTVDNVDDIRSLVEPVSEVVAGVVDQYREAAEAFGGQGENAERADELEDWQNDLESFYPDEPDEDASNDEQADAVENARQEAEDLLNGCPL